ncbi:hypothetical protein L6172_09905 [Thalassospiraceae bacterium SW-3-3]|nr:hypothetical protein L6172_09905 [Thalassospiraceae bacterium SW-3-3]
MDKVMKRLGERSTYYGLASVIGGLSLVVDFDEGAQIAATIQTAGDAVAGGNGLAGALVAIGAGILSVFTADKGNR